jgi:FdhE protein
VTTQAAPALDRFAQRRRRAEELQQRYAFAEKMLAFYAQLCRVQHRACAAALEDRPDPAQVAGYAAQRVLPQVIELSTASGPAYLAQAVVARFEDADFEEIIAAWLQGEELSVVDRYLARACAEPVLLALGDDAACACQGTFDERHCPVCGGLPQVSYFAASPEDLVTAHRYLECSRCSSVWAFARMTCACCGETESSKLQIFAETAQPPRFPHVRVDGCSTCSQYLLSIDLERERAAVPVADEIAAIPLDLYAKERGLNKIVPNAMGF